MVRLRDRPAVEWVTIVFAGTVCIVIILMTLAVAFAGVFTPNNADSLRFVQVLVSLVSTLLGALLGLLAGRTSPPRETREKEPT